VLPNALLSLWLAADGVHTLTGLEWRADSAPELALALALFALAGFSALRSPTHAVRTDAYAIVITTVSVLLPLAHMLLAPSEVPREAAVSLRAAGAVGLLGSALCLRDSFAVLPAARRLVTRGPYAWVRHPMYASYLLLDLSYWFPFGHTASWLVWTLELVLLVERARLEEGVLRANLPGYAAYMARVRFRLIPRIL